ncbi:MAG TPA: tryptophan synthase subunit alpha [Acidimicrobiia bacterium]|nr:tryptophan synthase subunit alpha [Acidimicrobiia bacterium]
MSEPATNVTEAIGDANGNALCAYLTAGYPSLEVFGSILASVAKAADVVEVGIPFTDPMADGQTIQEASHTALVNGVNLDVIFETLDGVDLEAPHVFMGYYNPFLAYGLERLVERMASVGTSGLIVPDLPLEESEELADMLEDRGLGLIQLVAPTTPTERLRRLATASRGFVYAVSTKGTTGGATEFDAGVLAYLDRVKEASDLPVLAGFGVRERAQVAALADHVDGVVVGTALIDAIDRGDDPAVFLKGLRP